MACQVGSGGSWIKETGTEALPPLGLAAASRVGWVGSPEAELSSRRRAVCLAGGARSTRERGRARGVVGHGDVPGERLVGVEVWVWGRAVWAARHVFPWRGAGTGRWRALESGRALLVCTSVVPTP